MPLCHKALDLQFICWPTHEKHPGISKAMYIQVPSQIKEIHISGVEVRHKYVLKKSLNNSSVLV